jgi:transposase
MARVRGQAANRRLHARWLSFDERKKRSVVANATIGPELAGWRWSLAVLDN